MAAAIACGPLMARAQEETDAGKGNPRDVAAADAALKGWWTEAAKTRDQRLEWWRDARFGCFIHWGVYADLGGEFEGRRGGGYSEHIMRQLKIPLKVYKEKVVANFDPEQFNADEWVKLIKGAGMRYVIITAKHHDGFAMWPSDAYPYDIRLTKFKRDPMKELSEACRKNGLHFGFYYSHAFDWEHPDAPGNDWDYDNPGGDRALHGKDWQDKHPELVAKAAKYVEEKAVPQLKELVAKYHPDIFWMDVGGKLPFSLQLRCVQAVREADPNVIINGRPARGLGRNWGDYANTADRPAELRQVSGDTECIPTCNESYGYHKFDMSYKPPAHFIQLLAKAAAKGSNVLLNVGPMGNGEIDPHSTAILQGIGKWMDVNAESIRGTQRTPLDRQAWGESTTKGNTIYLHVFDWPSDQKLVVGGLQNAVSSAYLLADPTKAPLKADRLNDKDVVVQLPVSAPDPVDSVVVLQLDGPAKGVPGRLLQTDVKDNRLLAFDGEVRGKGFKYGDGKTANYWVNGFTDESKTISWNTRVNQPAEFEVSVQYSTPSKEQTGTYKVKIGEQSVEGQVKPTGGAKDLQTAKLGRVKVPAGEQELVLRPEKVDGGDLMNLFEIDLTPVK
jgi:alpha-L-fucosidase